MMFYFESILQIWIILIGFRDTNDFVNLGVCKHEFKFTCRGYCRFTLRFNVSRSFVTMATNLPSCFSIQFLEQLLKFLVNFTLLKYVESQRSYGFLITKELIIVFQILDLKDHFSAENLKQKNTLFGSILFYLYVFWELTLWHVLTKS